MAKGLDNRHRDKDGEIEKKHAHRYDGRKDGSTAHEPT